MTAAATAMGKAVTSLERAQDRGGAAAGDGRAEPSAEGAGRREEARGVAAAGGQRQRDNNRTTQDMSRLFDKELQSQQQTNYETPKGAASRSRTRRDALDKIKELARRQDELLKRAAGARARPRPDDRGGAEARAREADARAVRPAPARRGDGAADGVSSSRPEIVAAVGASGSEAEQGKGPAGQARRTRAGGRSRAGGGDTSKQMRAISEEMRSAGERSAPPESGTGERARQQGTRKAARARKAAAGGDAPTSGAARWARCSSKRASWQMPSDRSPPSWLNKTAPGEARRRDALRRLAGEQERLADRTRRVQDGLDAAGGGHRGPSGERTTTKTGSADRGAAASGIVGEAADRMPNAAAAPRRRNRPTIVRAAARPRRPARAGGGARRSWHGRSTSWPTRWAATLRATTTRGSSRSSSRARRNCANRWTGISKELEQLGQQNGRSAAQPGTQKSPGDAARSGEGQQAGSGGGGSDLARLRQEYSNGSSRRASSSTRCGATIRALPRAAPGLTFEGQGMTLSAPGTEAFKQDFADVGSLLRKQATQALDQAESTLSKRLQAKPARRPARRRRRRQSAGRLPKAGGQLLQGAGGTQETSQQP